MRKMLLPLAAVAVALLAAGCTGPEQKLGRGLSNCYEVIRLGELRRSVEQDAIEPMPGTGAYGFFRGIDRSVARATLGVFETVTFPIPTPTYQPMFTRYLTPDPAFPANFTPGLLSDSLFDTDTYTGVGCGDVAPFIPGSRFQVF
jgi:putative exosortase-associated protein (TIGR04073 family)